MPKSCQDCDTISPKSHQNLVGVALRSHPNLAEISPQLQYDVPKTRRIAIRSHHSCTTMSPRLAGLLYYLATVALRCLQDSQDGYTISPQVHYDVSKTRRIAIRSHHSCTKMSPGLAGLLYDLTTVAQRCPLDSQDCYTISPQLHYDVPKSCRVVINNDTTIFLLHHTRR